MIVPVVIVQLPYDVQNKVSEDSHCGAKDGHMATELKQGRNRFNEVRVGNGKRSDANTCRHTNNTQHA